MTVSQATCSQKVRALACVYVGPHTYAVIEREFGGQTDCLGQLILHSPSAKKRDTYGGNLRVRTIILTVITLGCQVVPEDNAWSLGVPQ